jgi:hypothetical protein
VVRRAVARRAVVRRAVDSAGANSLPAQSPPITRISIGVVRGDNSIPHELKGSIESRSAWLRGQWQSVSTHCGIVTNQLQRVQKAHDWKRRIPVLRNAVRRLDEMGQKWMANDARLYESMNDFMNSVNDAFGTINKRYKTPAKALGELQAILQGTETSLLKIKAYSNELKLISSKI